jgi:hypothetical protein
MVLQSDIGEKGIGLNNEHPRGKSGISSCERYADVTNFSKVLLDTCIKTVLPTCKIFHKNKNNK